MVPFPLRVHVLLLYIHSKGGAQDTRGRAPRRSTVSAVLERASRLETVKITLSGLGVQGLRVEGFRV